MKNSGSSPIPGFECLTVDQIMEKQVQSANDKTKVDVLASSMVEGFGSIPIVDQQQRLIGIISEYDLLTALGRGRPLNDRAAYEIMTRHPASVSPKTNIMTLIGILQSSRFIRMPVVDSNGKLIGVIARRDILRAYLNSNSEPDWSGIMGYW